MLEAAQHIADDVLFPRALDTDRAALVPMDLLDELAAAGLYGLTGPAEVGGAGLRDRRAVWDTVERLASGCLTTTFVWAQHLGTVTAVAERAGPELRARWLRSLCSGEVRAGVAFSALRRPGPPMLTASPVAGGWALQGSAPWVSGWGRIDVIRVAARHGEDIVWTLVDVAPGPALQAEPLELAAVNASGTVTLRFERCTVPEDRVILIEPFEAWRARDREGLRLNGSHALGVAGRCVRLLGDAARTDDSSAVSAIRSELDHATAETLPHARARASRLAMRLAERLVITGGGGSVLLSNHAQRLAREALFLLVFGQTPVIRQQQLTG